MRILVFIAPSASHLSPMLPVLRALAAAGHDLLAVSSPGFRAAIERAGARLVPLPREALPRPGLGGSLRAEILERFIGLGPAQCRALAGADQAFQAELLLSDPGLAPGLYADLSAAAGRRLPWVVLGIVPLSLGAGAPPLGLALRPGGRWWHRLRDRAARWLLDRLLYRAVEEAVARSRAELGLGPLSSPSLDYVVERPALYLQGTVPGFEYPRTRLPPSLHFVGPFLPAAPPAASGREWWAELPGRRPLVFVTQGQVDNDPRKLVLPALDALAGEDVEVVAATGGASLDPARCPANARVVPFVPYAEIMPRASVVVTNAGYGGVQCALAAGVPLVVAGRQQEKGEICARVAWSGAGIDLRTDRPRPSAVLRAVRRALAEPRYRRCAQAFQAEIARGSAVLRAVALIEAAPGG